VAVEGEALQLQIDWKRPGTQGRQRMEDSVPSKRAPEKVVPDEEGPGVVRNALGNIIKPQKRSKAGGLQVGRLPTRRCNRFDWHEKMQARFELRGA